MDTNAYKQLLDTFVAKPNILNIKEGSKFPPTWPLMLITLIHIDKNFLIAEMTDLKAVARCHIKDAISIKKLTNAEEENVFFLHNARVIKKKDTTADLSVEKVFTLKEAAAMEPKKSGSKVKEGQKIKIKLKKSTDPRRGKMTPKIMSPSPAEKEDSQWRTLAERWEKQGKKLP